MKYKAKDFASCQFNPLSDGKLLETYELLHEIICPEYVDDPNLDNLLRFVILVYDPKSPLVFNERDLFHRKGNAADLCGLDILESEMLDDIYNCNHPFISELIFRYLTRFAKSKEWAAYCALEFTYWESIRLLLEPIATGNSKVQLEAVQKKSAIKEELDRDSKRIETFFKAFCGEDTDLMDKVRTRMTPERLAASK